LKNPDVNLRANKIGVARRQLDAAIRMFFAPEDPLAIQSVMSAAERILRDLAESSGKFSVHETLEPYIRKGMEKQFWAAFNKSADFLKQADTDPDTNLEFDEQRNEIGIFTCCLYYQGLGCQLTPDMRGFMWWYSLMNPDLLLEATPAKDILFQPDFERIRTSSRDTQLVFGRRLCAIVKKLGG
jgi:hypothetical protein